MLHYFTQLPKERKLTFKENIDVSMAIMHNAKNAFTPFYQYLDSTIRSLVKKEHIKAKWTKVEQESLVELKIIGCLYEIPKTTKFKLLNTKKGIYSIEGKYEKDFDNPLFIWQNEEKITINLSEKNFISENKVTFGKIYENINKANWAGEKITIKPDWLIVNKNDKIIQNNNAYKIKSINGDIIEVEGILDTSPTIINNQQASIKITEITKQALNTKLIKEENNRFIVYSENPTNQRQDRKLFSLLKKENIIFKDHSKFNAEHQENLIFKVKNKASIGKKVICNNVKFIISELPQKNKDLFWIQLHEIDEEKDDIPGFSPLKYFFDDDILIKDDFRNEYSVVRGIESENKLILQEKNGKRECTFPKGERLQVKVNIYQLRKQLDAILALQNMPVCEHSNLIKLFEKRNKARWKNTENKQIEKWIVLIDESRNGIEDQQEFVEKALSTQDFAILEGPPGSGKTTVILELICQLIEQGKRVLLCGSTHVAIDNVLERLKEKCDNTSLIERFNILPVRIGDKNRINEDVRNFQIDNLIEEHDISESLLLEMANLVCGTTIGILQHPKFKNRKSLIEPIVPEFDYLIIDESSKTTFQEFLVPGLYAKRWILTGDIMQLSPFTDREQIVANLETLLLKNNKLLPKEYQQATFYLCKLLKIINYAKNKFILPVENNVSKALFAELEKRNPNKIFTFFDTKNYNKLKLVASDVIIIDKNLLDKYISKLPETHAILRSESWQTTEHAFIHNNWQKRGNSFKFRDYKNEFKNSYEIVDNTNIYFKEKSWAEEIAWRIDREHKLRLLDKNKIQNYKKIIEELIPLSLDKKDIEERINNLASIAFPSILESLIKGIKGRKTKDKTTISEGFSEQELKSRRTVLKYQHRMHPEISSFPREQFYKAENALLDLESPKTIAEIRQWNYNRYTKRSSWINISGKTIKNYNNEEVKQLILELKYFIEYASCNNHPEGKDWTVACLTFYKGQERKIREKLQELTGKERAFSNFNIQQNGRKINIKLHTVDKFQGHEADIVFLSMVQTFKDGFMDNPNRLNVAITRAKFQLVIIGDYNYFKQKSRSNDLKQLAQNTQIYKTNESNINKKNKS